MKRFFIFCVIYSLFLCVPLQANSDFEYRIYTNDQTNLLKTKTKVLEILDTMLMGVKQESYGTIVKENLDAFYWQKDMKVSFKNNVLTIVIAEGNKKILHGKYEKSGVCFKVVKKKSVLKEWLKKSDE